MPLLDHDPVLPQLLFRLEPAFIGDAIGRQGRPIHHCGQSHPLEERHDPIPFRPRHDPIPFRPRYEAELRVMARPAPLVATPAAGSLRRGWIILLRGFIHYDHTAQFRRMADELYVPRAA
jgi:hypothetical protein